MVIAVAFMEVHFNLLADNSNWVLPKFVTAAATTTTNQNFIFASTMAVEAVNLDTTTIDVVVISALVTTALGLVKVMVVVIKVDVTICFL